MNLYIYGLYVIQKMWNEPFIPEIRGSNKIFCYLIRFNRLLSPMVSLLTIKLIEFVSLFDWINGCLKIIVQQSQHDTDLNASTEREYCKFFIN